MRIGVYGIGNVFAHDDAVGRRSCVSSTYLAGFDAVVLVDAVSDATRREQARDADLWWAA